MVKPSPRTAVGGRTMFTLPQNGVEARRWTGGQSRCQSGGNSVPRVSQAHCPRSFAARMPRARTIPPGFVPRGLGTKPLRTAPELLHSDFMVSFVSDEVTRLAV